MPLPKRLLTVTLALAGLVAAFPAWGATRLTSDTTHRLEHETGVPWVALVDSPSTGTGYDLRPSRPPASPWLAPNEDPVHGAIRFFVVYRALFQMVDPVHELHVFGRGGGEDAQAAFFTQVEGGVPVAPSGLSVEFDGTGRIERITGSFRPHLHGMHAAHVLTPAHAKAAARADMARRFPRPHPTYTDTPAPELCISVAGAAPRVAYRLIVDYAGVEGTLSYTIDANTGAILAAAPLGSEGG